MRCPFKADVRKAGYDTTSFSPPICLKNEFNSQRREKGFVLVNQHGRREVGCKPAILMTQHYPDLGNASASDRLKQISLAE